MKLLLSGFTSFDGDTRNPSEELLEVMKQKTWPFELHTELLPVSFKRSFTQLAARIDVVNPDVVVMLGLAKNRPDITVERIGINWLDARIPDVDGVRPVNQKISTNGPDGLFTRLPLEEMIAAAQSSRVSAKISSSAGEYVCNALLYQILAAYPALPAGFIHLPWIVDSVGVEKMLAACYHHTIMNK
jgi:pyroglutamyl-peptidase